MADLVLSGTKLTLTAAGLLLGSQLDLHAGIAANDIMLHLFRVTNHFNIIESLQQLFPQNAQLHFR